jgi:uncharacterized protein (TIGR03437 family)
MCALTRCALAALALATASFGDSACKPNAPCYSAAGVVNAASNLPDSLAAFTWVSVYGTGLSFQTASLMGGEGLPGFGGVSVLINNVPSFVSYVSPLQVNFLVPFVTAREVVLQITREGTAGPAVTIKLSDCAPALFLRDADTAVAAHPEDPAHYTEVTPESPARAGEVIILYATGLGAFLYPFSDTDLPATANPILRLPEFTLMLDGKPVDDRLIEYVGTAPGFIGVYQINLRLPDPIGGNPEIRIGLGERLSPPGIHLLAK